MRFLPRVPPRLVPLYASTLNASVQFLRNSQSRIITPQFHNYGLDHSQWEAPGRAPRMKPRDQCYIQTLSYNTNFAVQIFPSYRLILISGHGVADRM